MIRLRTLPNGVRVVTERIASVRSCAVGLWLESGSRYEAAEARGLTHFIEHMLFKGTRRRNVHQLADAMNFLGGNVNAFTGQETLCLHAKTIDLKAPDALSLLLEMFVDSVFPKDEIARERRVILEEAKMLDDAPDERSMDIFMKNLWPGHPLGEPVIGEPRTIRKFNRELTLEYWAREFVPSRLVVAVAGAFDPKAIGKVVDEWLLKLPGRNGGARRTSKPAAKVERKQSVLHRPVEQVHFCLGVPGSHRKSPDRFAFTLMNTVLGGGMSSRLFREIREKRGLAYSIGSFLQLFSDSGYFAVSGGTSPATLREVLTITKAEIERICAEPVSEEELEMARAQVLDSLMMGLENTEHRMTRLADGLITWGRVVPVDEVVAAVNEVTPADVRRTARKYLEGKELAASLVAPKTGKKIGLGVLKS